MNYISLNMDIISSPNHIGCGSLITVSLPASLTSIETSVFQGIQICIIRFKEYCACQIKIFSQIVRILEASPSRRRH